MKEVRIYVNGKTKKISYTSEEDIKKLVEEKNVYIVQKTRSGKKNEDFSISKLTYENGKFDKIEEKYISEIKLDSKNIYLFEIGLFIDIYNNIFKKIENKDLKYKSLIKLINDDEKLLHNKKSDSNSVKEKREYREYHNKKLLEGYQFFKNSRFYTLEMLIIADNINYYYENKLKFEDIKTILHGTDDEAKIHLDYIKDIERNKEARKQLEETEKELKLHADLLPILKKESIHIDEDYIKNMSFDELKKAIENINMLISSSKELNYINHDIIKKYILCLYYIFEREEINKLFCNIDLDKNIIYYDLHFYYFIFIIYTLNNKNKLDNKEYKDVINLYIEKYNNLKKEKSDLFDRAYNSDIAKRYELKNLNHDNYLKNDSYLHFTDKYNDYRDLFFEDDKDYYNFVLFLCNKIKFGIYFNLADYQENIFINEHKEMNFQKSDNTINNIIIQIEDIKIARKIAERFYFLKLITFKEYGTISEYLNSMLIELSYNHIETIKNYIKDENRILKSYVCNIFNYIIDFYNNIKTDKLLYYYFSKKIIKEQKIIDDYASDFSLDELEIIDESKESFINENEENISDDNLDISKQLDILIKKAIIGLDENYKSEKEIFFKMNHSIIMMITKYFYKDNIKENFIKNIEYLYKLQPYRSYLFHNKMIDYDNIFISTSGYSLIFDDIELAQIFFSSVE